nr:fiber protein [Lemur mastadenovirus]WGN96542.1 fiber protein [Lemur mastadenovirus]
MSKKRIVANDFDPVYPYTEQRFNLMPPFYSSNGLEVVDGASLAVKTQNPLGFSSSGDLTLKLGAGLTTNQNGELEASGTSIPSLSPPLIEQGGAITIDLGDGLKTDNGKLMIKSQNPFSFDGGNLSLITGDGLEEDSNGALKLKTEAPMKFTSGALGIATGNGLDTNPTTNQLRIKCNHPLTFDNAANLKIHMNYPFVISNNALSLNLNSSSALSINQVLKVNTTTPLSVTSNSITLNTGRGLVKNGNNLEARLGTGLSFDNNGAISAAAISATSQDITLWTTPDPSANIQIITAQLNGILMLTLTKTGGLVTGNVSLIGTGAPLTGINISDYTVKLYFNNGNLDTTNSDLKGTWGWRQNNTTASSSSKSGLLLMPNSSAYPPVTNNQTPSPKSIIVTTVYQNNDTNKPITLRVYLNSHLSNTQQNSLIFTWSGFTNHSVGGTVNVTPATFSYVPQQSSD